MWKSRQQQMASICIWIWTLTCISAKKNVTSVYCWYKLELTQSCKLIPGKLLQIALMSQIEYVGSFTANCALSESVSARHGLPQRPKDTFRLANEENRKQLKLFFFLPQLWLLRWVNIFYDLTSKKISETSKEKFHFHPQFFSAPINLISLLSVKSSLICSSPSLFLCVSMTRGCRTEMPLCILNHLKMITTDLNPLKPNPRSQGVSGKDVDGASCRADR